MPPTGGEHCPGLPPDVLSDLPDNVIDVILMCLPCKDAVCTSVLSRKWRYHWCRLAKWKFDESLWSTQKDTLYPTVKLRKIVYQLLTHHEGPITKFTLAITDLKKCPEIDNFIYFLSRKGIQHLVLHLPQRELYVLPSSLFICSQLKHLNLHNCSIPHPSVCKGFDRLVSLVLCRVSISFELLEGLIARCVLLEQLVLKDLLTLNIIEINAPMLRSFEFTGNISSICLKNVPLLEQLVLKDLLTLNIIEINAPMLRSFEFTGNISSICLKNVPLLAKVSLQFESLSMEAHKFDYAKFFESCSALEHLFLNFGFCKFLADEAPTRLPVCLNRVKHFHLSHIVMKESYKLSCSLCLLRSFPYLEYLKIKVYMGSEDDDDRILQPLELEHFSDVTFDHLRKVKLVSFGGTTPEMQLIKLLLAKSPVLVKMKIYPDFSVDERPELLNFPRASPKAEIEYKLYCCLS